MLTGADVAQVGAADLHDGLVFMGDSASSEAAAALQAARVALIAVRPPYIFPLRFPQLLSSNSMCGCREC